VKVTYRYRVKDKHKASLNRQAKAVNYVWNYCNYVQKQALKWNRKWPTGYDLQRLTSGTSKELGISSDSIGKICAQYEKSRRQHKKPYLRYRGRNSLGWIPLKGREIKIRNDGFFTFGETYSVSLSRKIPADAKICDGSSFSQDSKGHWYLNLVLELPVIATPAPTAVGIDLGLKDFATMSTGEKIAAPQIYRKTERKLATAQRARKKGQITSLRAKAANQRRDFHHKLSSNIVASHGLIVVGNVNSSALKKTRMAKSVSDAGWSSFRGMLAYKSIANGAEFMEVNEAFTTQACSNCGAIGGPKGREGLSVREWSCYCGASHDRDINSAKNILRLGHETLAGAAKSRRWQNDALEQIKASPGGGSVPD
jgi:putative transposase